MINEEELIEVMAEAIDATPFYGLSYKDCKVVAQAVLKALCKALPDATMECNSEIGREARLGDVLVSSAYYNQLKAIGDKK